MFEIGSGCLQKCFCSCKPNPLHKTGSGPICLRCSKQKWTEKLGSGSRCLAMRFIGVCKAKCYCLIPHRRRHIRPDMANSTAPVLSIRCCDTCLVFPGLEDILVLGFLPGIPTECWMNWVEKFICRYIKYMDVCAVSPISHFTERPCKLFLFLTGTVQLKGSAVLK